MAQEFSFHDVQIHSTDIHVRKIQVEDLWQSLREGYSDFNARPSHFAFLFIIYPLFAVLLTLFLVGGSLLQFAFPLPEWRYFWLVLWRYYPSWGIRPGICTAN